MDLRQDATSYFDLHHTVNDVVENVSPADLSRATAAFALTTLVIADATESFRED